MHIYQVFSSIEFSLRINWKEKNCLEFNTVSSECFQICINVVFNIGRKKLSRRECRTKCPLQYNDCQRWWFLAEITPQKTYFIWKYFPFPWTVEKPSNKWNGCYPCGLSIFSSFLSFILSEPYFTLKKQNSFSGTLLFVKKRKKT